MTRNITGLDATFGSGIAGASGVAIHYCNGTGWSPSDRKFSIVCQDHGERLLDANGSWVVENGVEVPAARHIEYDDASNTIRTVRQSRVGSHAYNHNCANTLNGDKYLYWNSNVYRSRNSGPYEKIATTPDNLTQIIAASLTFWSSTLTGGGNAGALLVSEGNSGSIHILNLATMTWTTLRGMTPGRVGIYHNVAAYSEKKNVMVYGGGGGGNAPTAARTNGAVYPDNRKLWRLNADGSKTAMPDAPHHVGIFSGMNLQSDRSSGNFLLLGFGELWELNPDGAGTWTQQTGTRAPPAALLQPGVPNGFCSVDCSTYGVVLYFDALRGRAPKSRAWAYKHAA